MISLLEAVKDTAVLKIRINGSPHYGRDILTLQFFPESISDSYQTNWDSKDIPGGSHPLYAWKSGGERGFSFQTSIYRDNSQSTSMNSKEDKYNYDVDATVKWLRSLMLPTYKHNLSFPPPMLQLVFPIKTNLSIAKGNRINCIMTGCSINYVKWFMNGRTKYVTADLTFNQIVQSKSGVRFMGV